jgi:hypothetical protein
MIVFILHLLQESGMVYSSWGVLQLVVQFPKKDGGEANAHDPSTAHEESMVQELQKHIATRAIKVTELGREEENVETQGSKSEREREQVPNGGSRNGGIVSGSH